MTKRRQRYPQQPDDSIVIRKLIKPKTETQAQLAEALASSQLTMCIGPAGTGKTFLAIHEALRQLLDSRVDRVVITRPVVEAEESLGFLPGTLEDKLAPYLIPLLDAVRDLVGPTMCKRLLDSGRLEIAPLAYMRGRTFNNCFVVADEMQNATVNQIKLLVTRLGHNCRASLNGDPAQCDLPRGSQNGISWLWDRLSLCQDQRISQVEFTRSDVVRSDLVKVLLCYLE